MVLSGAAPGESKTVLSNCKSGPILRLALETRGKQIARRARETARSPAPMPSRFGQSSASPPPGATQTPLKPAFARKSVEFPLLASTNVVYPEASESGRP